jgi:nitrogen fixation protein NifX
MKVAFATTRGTTVDEHFGRASAFSVWDIGQEGSTFVELRRVAEGDLDSEVVVTRGMGELHDEAIASKIEKLADCKIVYFTEIGGPSAAKLVRRGMMPLKTAPSTGIEGLVADLETTIRERPTPWMRKALESDRPS